MPLSFRKEERRMNRPQTGSLSERRTGLLSERRLQTSQFQYMFFVIPLQRISCSTAWTHQANSRVSRTCQRGNDNDLHTRCQGSAQSCHQSARRTPPKPLERVGPQVVAIAIGACYGNP